MKAPRATSATDVVEVLARHGVTHVVGLPDGRSAPFIQTVHARQGMRYVPVTREGEAFAVASGLWMGGARPVVCVQNSGLLESGDALRGTAGRMGVPLLTFVTYRGVQTLDHLSRPPGRLPHDRDELTRPDVDSAAVLTEPTLAAWGVPFGPLRTADDVAAALERAEREARPVALLVERFG